MYSHTLTLAHNPACSAIKAINQSWPEAKIESCSDGYICYIPSSICLAALDNAASFVCKHIVPITPIQLAKHEMTVKAVWGAFCLQTQQGGDSLRAPPRKDKAGRDFSPDEEPLHLSVQTFSRFIKWKLRSVSVLITPALITSVRHSKCQGAPVLMAVGKTGSTVRFSPNGCTDTSVIRHTRRWNHPSAATR